MIEFNAKMQVGSGALRARVLAAVRQGMTDAMADLAKAAAGKAPERTGKLRAAILASPKVTETTAFITGTVTGDVGRRHVALWQEEGIRDPAVEAKNGRRVMRAYLLDNTVFYLRRHRAFSVPGRPFMRPTLDEQEPTIFETIRAAVAKGVAV